MKKILALTLSLLMVFSIVPFAALAEGENYCTVFDASSEGAASQIGTKYSGSAAIATYAVPQEDGSTVDRTVLKYTRTGAYNGAGVGIKADYRSVIKGAIGIRFWMAGDPATFDSSDAVSLSFQTGSMGYKTAGEHKGNWKPTLDGGSYEWYWNTTTNVYQVGATTNDASYKVAGTAKALFTEEFLSQVKQIMFGCDAYSAGSLKEVFYIDDVEFIYPEGVEPAPIEYTASFEGTETAELAEAIPSVKSDAQNGDSVVMPEATLVDGELAGWATAAAPTTVIAPGETTTIKANTTFYAVRVNKPALETPAKPVASIIEGQKVTLEAVTGAVYSKDGATWQTSNVFSGLTPGETYTFYAKMAESLTHAESAVSEGLTIKTPEEYKFEAENCSPKGYKADGTTHTPGVYNASDGGKSYSYVQDNNTNKVGAYNTFTVKGIAEGIYTLTTYSRNVNTRSKYQVTVIDANGVEVGNFGLVDFTDFTYKFSGASYHSANYLPNEVIIPNAGDYTLKFTNKVAGSTGICLDAITLTKVGDLTSSTVTIDGEEVGTFDRGATYVIPTPKTGTYYVSGENVYYGGEEVVLDKNLNLTTEVKKTQVVYTMDEGSTLEGGIFHFGAGEIMDVNGDKKLAIKAKSDASATLKLPEGWANIPYYKATKVTFTASTNSTTNVKAFKNMYFSETLKSDYTASGASYQLFGASNMKYFNTTISLNVTEEMYGYRYFSGQLYSGNHTDAAPLYVYFDNVIIEYEYDFDYVEPVEPTTYDITIDGEVVATVEEGTEYTLPELPAGKYYVGNPETTFVVTESVAFTTATYTYDITIDGEVVANVAYGETYVLPELEAGKYYVDVTETTFVVTGALAFTTATYTYEITVDGEVVATVAYGTEYTLPELAAGKYYVDVEETTFVVTGALAFTTATYTYDITIDGDVVATVEYGTEYTLPALEAGKYYVDVTETTFVVTGALTFTTATYTFDITIDGVLTATVAYGETFVLPATIEGKQYVGGYVAGQEFVVTEALAFTTEDIPAPEVSVSTKTGAGVRFNEVTGLRFTATIDTAAVEEAKALGYEVTMGTLIAPADRFASYDDLTFEADANNYLDVVTGGYYNEENGTIAGTISNIKEANWGRDFFARAYVKLVKGDEVVVYYAEAANARSIKSVAEAALDDDTAEYNDAQVALLEKWAAAKAW